MIENIINSFSSLSPISIYLAVFIIAYIENIFPPFPSDVLVAISASLIISGKINFIILLIVAVSGSTLGFITMYFIGKLFGKRILDSGKIKFIKKESIDKFENSMHKYGKILIVLNRFLAGTRAIVSFAVGMGHNRLWLVVLLSFISSLIWNGFLIYLGYSIGENVQLIDNYLMTYNKIVISIIILGSVIFFIRWYWKRKTKNEN